MTNPTVAAFGSWKSPITSDLIAAETIRFAGVFINGVDAYWLEIRPREGGRYVLVRRTADGSIADITPTPFNARTRVHEYGGGAVIIANGTVWFSNFADQRLYWQKLRKGSRAPQPLSPAAELRMRTECSIATVTRSSAYAKITRRARIASSTL